MIILSVRFRAIPINTELKAFDGAADVYMLDPKRHIMKRWLSRQSTLGTISLEYQLSDQPVFGLWTIQIIAQGQIEEATFTVEEYYQTRFEVSIRLCFLLQSYLLILSRRLTLPCQRFSLLTKNTYTVL